MKCASMRVKNIIEYYKVLEKEKQDYEQALYRLGNCDGDDVDDERLPFSPQLKTNHAYNAIKTCLDIVNMKTEWLGNLDVETEIADGDISNFKNINNIRFTERG